MKMQRIDQGTRSGANRIDMLLSLSLLASLWAFTPSTVAWAQQAAAEPVAAASDAESITVVSYEVDGGSLEAAATELRQRFGQLPDVRIATDTRLQRLIVSAPLGVHQRIRRELSDDRPSQPARSESARASRTTPRTTPTTRRRPAMTDASGRLQHADWRDLIAAVQTMSNNRIALTPTDDNKGLQATLPSATGQTGLRIDPDTGQYALRGSAALVAAWQNVIQVLDRPVEPRLDTTRLVALRDANPAAVQRAVQLLQTAPPRTSPAKRWSADVIGITPRSERVREPVQLAQAPGDNPPQQPPAEPQPPEGGEVGVDGALVGPGPVIEYVEGLDAIIIRGRRQDVERIQRIISDLERISADTEPAVELVPLEHVNSQSMSDMVSQLNAQTLAIRLGTVSITPLVKPNALLLIGRKEGVESTIELIKRLDQPVAPSTQFSIVRLKHIPANDALQTINGFFEGRTGLGTRVQLQADFRTNSLIIYASPRDMAEVSALLKEIDVADNAASSEVRVFKLRNALAEELATVLEATLRGESTEAAAGQAGGATTALTPRSSTLTMTRIDAQSKRILKSGILTEVRVAADVRANSLVVTAPAESMELIAALVSQLDELPTSEAQIKVFNIVNGDALILVQMLTELFGQQNQATQQGPALQSATGAGETSLVPLRFSTDARTNSIIATGSMADLGVVEAILLRLDESDRSLRRSQVYRLQNAPAENVANAITQFLNTQRQLQLQIAPDTISPYAQIEREVIVVPELVSNSLIISATPRYFDEIAALIEELDERPPMVLIQVLIAEVDLDSTEELGVELGIQDSLLFDRGVISDVVSPGFNFNNQALGSSSSAQSLATRENTAGQALSSFSLGRTNSELGYGGLVLSASSESISVLIRALQESRRLDVLSRPQVMTLNNQPAFILVGSRVPRIQSTNQTQFGVVNNTILENVGLLLGVTPRISPDGLVVMEIDAEKSELGPINEGIPISINVAGDVIRSPIINTTVAQTTVSARSGQTVILGGLITKNRSVISRSVPFLGDLPVLGQLFRFDSVSDSRTELLIIMTPYIVRKAEDAEWLNQIEMQRMSWCLADVVSIHGDVGTVGSTGMNPLMLDGYGLDIEDGPDQVPTQVVYPNQTPELRTSPNVDPLPAPAVPPVDAETSPWQSLPPAESSLPLAPLPNAPQANRQRPDQAVSPVQFLDKAESQWTSSPNSRAIHRLGQ